MSQTSNSTTNSIDDTEYTVEAILAVRFVGVQAQFLVKWVDIELDETNQGSILTGHAMPSSPLRSANSGTGGRDCPAVVRNPIAGRTPWPDRQRSQG